MIEQQQAGSKAKQADSSKQAAEPVSDTLAKRAGSSKQAARPSRQAHGTPGGPARQQLV